MITDELRKKLKSEAHHLKPVIMIGKNGLTESLVKAVDRALREHELIKVKFLGMKEEKHEASAFIAESTSSDLIGITGNIAILYRKNDDE